jgi:hypothetical protein
VRWEADRGNGEKKVQSQEIQTEIEKQTIQIAQKQEDVKADLAQVEPAVIEAQQGRQARTTVI